MQMTDRIKKIYVQIYGGHTVFLVSLAALAISLFIFTRFPFDNAHYINHAGVRWFVSVFDLGFVKKTFVGTAIYPFRLLLGQSKLFYIIWFVSISALFIFYVETVIIFKRNKKLPEPVSRMLTICLLASPCGLLHLGLFAVATAFDALTFAVFLGCIIFIENTLVVTGLIALGVLIHFNFLMLFFIPILSYAVINKYRVGEERSPLLPQLLLWTATAIMLVVPQALFGALHVSKAEYLDILRNIFGFVPEYQYFIEMFGSVKDNIEFTAEYGWKLLGWMDSLNLVYILAGLILFFPLKAPKRIQALFVAGCASPLATCLIATDFARWAAASALATLILGAGVIANPHLTCHAKRRPALLLILLLLSFSGPYGKSPGVPFPLPDLALHALHLR